MSNVHHRIAREEAKVQDGVLQVLTGVVVILAEVAVDMIVVAAVAEEANGC
jgi:hypothetical protein